MFKELWAISAREYLQLQERHQVEPSDDAFDMFGLDPRDCDDDQHRFIFALTCFSGTIFGDDHRRFREAQRRAMKTRSLARLLKQFEETPLQIWCVHADDYGVLDDSHLIVGPDSDRLRRVDGLFPLVNNDIPDVFACWPITFEGWRMLMAAMPLEQDAVDRFVEDTEDVPISSFHDFWHDSLFDVVYTIVPPEDDWGWEEDYSPSSYASSWAPPNWLKEEIIEALERDPDQPLRLQIAKARSAEDMKQALIRIQEVRVSYLGSIATVYNRSVESILPIQDILDQYGVALDGSMSSELVVASQQHPVAILSVDPEVLHRARLESITPLDKALEWARANPDNPSSEVLVDAAERYLTERRWLATLQSWQQAHPKQPPRKLYDLYMEGFVSVVDGAVFDTTPEEMGVEPKSLKRLRKALAEKRPPSTFENLGDLPTSIAKLSELPGIGNVTLDDLASALFRCAQTWRESRSGVELQHVEAVKRSDDTELRDGLDELAALFGDLE